MVGGAERGGIPARPVEGDVECRDHRREALRLSYNDVTRRTALAAQERFQSTA
jgi:hypothetical protein